MSANRITVIVLAVAAVAIVAVLTLGGGDESEPSQSAEDRASVSEDTPPASEEVEPGDSGIPENPDDVHGSDEYALTRPANLRRALELLDQRRRRVEGVFDGLRVAPGRIDTIIIHPDDRRTNLQVRADFSVPFESTHDFPTQANFRDGGLSARDVDVEVPQRLLRAIDGKRGGSAEEDVDYLVIRKSPIDGAVDVNAYMRIRTARPRYFRWENGTAVPFG